MKNLILAFFRQLFARSENTLSVTFDSVDDCLAKLVESSTENWQSLATLDYAKDLHKAIVRQKAEIMVFTTMMTIKNGLVSSPLKILLSFRWFIPRAQREEIDLIIDDLKEDKFDMMGQKRAKSFIFLVLSWHVTRIITVYIWDGVTSMVKRVVPIARFLSK